MCSVTCPCPPEAAKIYENLTESDQTMFNRSDMITSESELTFSTFQQCWDQRLSTSSLFDSEFVQLVDDYLETMEIFESESSCSGICQPGLFWFTKPVTIAPPTDSCIDSMFIMGQDEDY